MNLDDLLGSPQACPIFMNLSNTPTTSIVLLLAHAQHPIVPTAPRST